MAGDGKNGKKNGGSISTYRTHDNKLGLKIDSRSKEIGEIRVIDAVGERTFHAGGEALESFVDKTFKMICKGRYNSKTSPENPDYQNHDSMKVYSALDFLIENLKPKVVTLQFHAGSMANVEPIINRIRDGDSYRSLRIDESKALSDFTINNPQYAIDPRSDEEMRLPFKKHGVFGGVEGESIIFPIHLEDVNEDAGRVAYVRLLGVPKLGENELNFIKAWEDNADFMLYTILDKNNEIISEVHRQLEKKDEENQNTEDTYELVKTDEKTPTFFAKREVDIPGRGYHTGSLFESKKGMVERRYQSLIGISEEHIYPNFLTLLTGVSPETVYKDDETVLKISEFAAKLTLAVMPDALREIKEIAKETGRKIDWKGFEEKDYILAAPFTALYVLSPKFMEKVDGSPIYPGLADENDIDKISTRFAIMLSPDGKGLFKGLTGEERRVGDLIIKMAEKMDSRAEDYCMGSKINMMTYITNVVEAIRHDTNYVMKSDLEDSLDSSAGKPHKVTEGIKYLMKVGYSAYAPLIAKAVLCDKAHKNFDAWYQKQQKGFNGSETSAKPRNGTGQIIEKVKKGAVTNGDK